MTQLPDITEELDDIIQQHRFDVEKLQPAEAFAKAKTALTQLIADKERQARIDALEVALMNVHISSTLSEVEIALEETIAELKGNKGDE